MKSREYRNKVVSKEKNLREGIYKKNIAKLKNTKHHYAGRYARTVHVGLDQRQNSAHASLVSLLDTTRSVLSSQSRDEVK